MDLNNFNQFYVKLCGFALNDFVSLLVLEK